MDIQHVLNCVPCCCFCCCCCCCCSKWYDTKYL